jgi:hypothetical protein
MSNVPDDLWRAPATAAPSPAVSVGWRVRHSWWLLLPLLGFGCLGGAGFLYVGLRARRPSWWIPGIAYLVLGWTAFILIGETDEESALSDWAVGAALAIWVAAVTHAALINPAWLRWRAGYRPWYQNQPAPPPSWQPPPSPPPWSSPSPPAAYYGAGPAAAPAVPAAPVAPVDVNVAGLDQLAGLPGFDPARAHHVLTQRAACRGFGSVEQFAAAAGLAPHEFARLRGIVICTPPVPDDRPPSPGRVLDV